MKKLLLIVSTLMLSVLAACAAPTSAIAVTTNGNAMLMTNVQTAPFRLVWSGTVAVVSTAAAPITVNGSRLATTNDLRAGTFTNLNIGGSNYSVSATIKAGSAIEFVHDGTGVTISATGLAPNLGDLSNGLAAVGAVASNHWPFANETNETVDPTQNIALGYHDLVVSNADGSAGYLIISRQLPDGWAGIGFARPGASTAWMHFGSDGVSPRMTVGATDYDFVHDGNLQSRFAIVTNGQHGVSVYGNFGGDASALTNLSASALASGTIPAGILGTNVARTVGGLTTTGSITAASFVGNGAGLTGIVAASSSPMFWSTNSSMDSAVTFAVPSNQAFSAFRIRAVIIQTNGASSLSAQSLYIVINGASGTNAWYGYQGDYSTHLTVAGLSDSNKPQGGLIGTLYSDPSYTNSAESIKVDVWNIHDQRGFKRWDSEALYRFRTAAGSGNQQITRIYGFSSVPGSVTSCAIVADRVWSNAVFSAGWMQ